MFRRLSPRDADGLARAMAPRHFAPGQLIVVPDPDRLADDFDLSS
jgi:hypothetical protein